MKLIAGRISFKIDGEIFNAWTCLSAHPWSSG